uniref:Uncharacterized protein n=1 Tax=Lactuca sativa TaxID=4236 RepID=A0A9R1WN29_LACSA|nr:hypothetical protein LSAT_V11C100015550 [Lactuca sativa]
MKGDDGVLRLGIRRAIQATVSSWQQLMLFLDNSKHSGVPAKGSKPEPLTSVQDINIQSQTLLNVKDSNKDERERIVVRMLKFEELRLEQIQDLENDLMKCFKEDLHSRLLSTDFKKQVDGIKMLQKALPAIANEIIEVLDILLKGFVLRFYESNTSCLLKLYGFIMCISATSTRAFKSVLQGMLLSSEGEKLN